MERIKEDVRAVSTQIAAYMDFHQYDQSEMIVKELVMGDGVRIEVHMQQYYWSWMNYLHVAGVTDMSELVNDVWLCIKGDPETSLEDAADQYIAQMKCALIIEISEIAQFKGMYANDNTLKGAPWNEYHGGKIYY